MAAGKNDRPIIIVKRKKKGAEAHHGGAWKVAYADFVTAMMAFFLVMWLVTAISKEQRAAIFEYFKNPSMETGKSVKAAPGQMGPGGASTSPINLGGGLDAPRTGMAKITELGANTLLARQKELDPRNHDPASRDGTKTETVEQARERIAEAEHKKLETLMVELKEAVSKSQALQPFKDQLLLDITPEGIRIQIVDAQNRPMFDVGSARLRDYTQSILKELTPYLSSVPNRISITGHTDIRPYPGQGGYSNWELSADRANAARRALVNAGMPDEKVARVVGLSSSVLFDREDPQSPINRRISIVIMTRQAEEEALKTDTANAMPAGTAPAAIDPTSPASAAPGGSAPGPGTRATGASSAAAPAAPPSAAVNPPAAALAPPSAAVSPPAAALAPPSAAVSPPATALAPSSAAIRPPATAPAAPPPRAGATRRPASAATG
jgi:chemotaxis protein MotB